MSFSCLAAHGLGEAAALLAQQIVSGSGAQCATANARAAVSRPGSVPGARPTFGWFIPRWPFLGCNPN